MSENNKEFYDLLKEVVTAETFVLELTDGKPYKFKQLSTSQLKELIKTVVDSPLTQSVFSNVVSRVMRESLVADDVNALSFNVLDRLLFILETRIQSISPTIKLVGDGKDEEVDVRVVKERFLSRIREHADILTVNTCSTDHITITFGLPDLKVESQLSDELYKDVNTSIETPDELRKVLGEAFINEIAKCVKTIKIQDKELDLSAVTFKSRLKTIESLPAALIGVVVAYVEKYRKAIDDSLTVKEGTTVPLDGSLFSLR